VAALPTLAASSTSDPAVARARALQCRSLTMKNNIVIALGLALALATTACKKSGSECERVFDHTVSLMPAEMKGKLAEGKADAIAKCEKLSPEARKCALDAKGLEDLMRCPRS
jgi:hypothetical protein